MILPNRNLNHEFIRKTNFEEHRCEVKQNYEEGQSYVVENGIEEADNRRSFMTIIRVTPDVA